jgi:hypothetical protein
MLLPLLVSTVRPPARASKTTVPQVQLKKLSSLSSHLPPASLRDAPTAFAHLTPKEKQIAIHNTSSVSGGFSPHELVYGKKTASVGGVRTDSRLSLAQAQNFRDVNARFSSLFRDHRESLAPTFTRRTYSCPPGTYSCPLGTYLYSRREVPTSTPSPTTVPLQRTLQKEKAGLFSP